MVLNEWPTMVPNQILKRMARGEKALGLTLRETSGLLVELAGRCGLDFVSFDAQHDTVAPAEIGEMCRIADAYGMTVSMRIPDGAESTILSYLDRGVRVITIPNLLTAEQAKDLVKYSFFAPLRLRRATSIATMHGQVDGDHVRLFQEVNANTVIVPNWEHRRPGEPGRDSHGRRHRLLRRRSRGHGAEPGATRRDRIIRA